MDIRDDLRKRIGDDPRPLAVLAREAGVPYLALYRWVTGRTLRYDVGCAERVYRTLTGRRFA